MIGKSDSRKLSVWMLIFGIAALALRWGVYASAVDAKGLLLRNHPLRIALTLLTAGTLIRVALAVRKMEFAEREEECDASDLPAAFGHVAAAAGILATVLTAAPMMSYLGIAWRWLGLAAPVCLLLAGAARVFGKKPFFLLHTAVCLFFLVHIVTCYQLWSGNPQLQDYVFALLAAMGLMFFGYYTAAREAGCGNARMRLGMGLAAIYLCLAELARSSCPALYLGGLFWVLTDLVSQRNIETN